MGESQRKPLHKTDTVDEEAQKRKDRMTLIIFLIGAVVIVAAMFLLSGFLSGN